MILKPVVRLVAVSACLLALTACARVQPIQNPQGQFVPPGLTKTQVKNAILAGASTKGWHAQEVSPGVIDASITVRHHYAEVKIPYSTQTYAIQYVTSTNLKANSQGGIHRNYNKWVTLLNANIQANLKLQQSKS